VLTKPISSTGNASVLLVLSRFTQYQWRYAGGWIHDPATSATQSILIAS
jgi:hypothetical protein